MSRPYSMHKYHGYLFSGNSIHPDELGWINAQLAAGTLGQGTQQSEQDDSVEAHIIVRPPAGRYNREFSSTILDRLQGRVDLLEGLAQVAVRNVLPDRWSLREQDGSDELARDRRLDTLQELGEAVIEASAA